MDGILTIIAVSLARDHVHPGHRIHVRLCVDIIIIINTTVHIRVHIVMIENENMNGNISKAVYNVRATLVVPPGCSRKATGNAITVRTSISNGEQCVISVSTPNAKTKARTTDAVKEAVLTMVNHEAVVVGIVNLCRIQVKADMLGIIGMIVITWAQAG